MSTERSASESQQTTTRLIVSKLLPTGLALLLHCSHVARSVFLTKGITKGITFMVAKREEAEGLQLARLCCKLLQATGDARVAACDKSALHTEQMCQFMRPKLRCQ